MMTRTKTPRFAPAVSVRAKTAAADVVSSWSRDELTRSLAADRLAKSWAVSLQSARDAIDAEQRRRAATERNYAQ